MRIGLISDTHCPDRCRFFPRSLGNLLRSVDLILHAGDVGEMWTLDALSELAPVIAVHGNDDSDDARSELPDQVITTQGDARILLYHGHYKDRKQEMAARRIDAWEPKLQQLEEMAREKDATVLVFGHTHIPMVQRRGDVALVNPGAIASGNSFRSQTTKSIAIMEVAEGKEPEIEHFDLSNWGCAFEPGVNPEDGFAVASGKFSGTILEPDLEALVPQMYGLQITDTKSIVACIQQLAAECWAGRKDRISRIELIALLSSDPNIVASDREALLGLLKG